MKLIRIKNNRPGNLELPHLLDAAGHRLVLKKDEERECHDDILKDAHVQKMLAAKPPWISINTPASAPTPEHAAAPEPAKTEVTMHDETAVPDEMLVGKVSETSVPKEESAPSAEAPSEDATPAPSDETTPRRKKR